MKIWVHKRELGMKFYSVDRENDEPTLGDVARMRIDSSPELKRFELDLIAMPILGTPCVAAAQYLCWLITADHAAVLAYAKNVYLNRIWMNYTNSHPLPRGQGRRRLKHADKLQLLERALSELPSTEVEFLRREVIPGSMWEDLLYQAAVPTEPAMAVAD